MAEDWSDRVLEFPVRTAAVADFLRDLKARGFADLSALHATFGESTLCMKTEGYWLQQGWIVPDPSSRMHVLAGPAFSRELSIADLAGAPERRDEFVRPTAEAYEGETAQGKEKQDR